MKKSIISKKLLRKLGQKLKEEKFLLEEELARFAKRDEKFKGDWKTIFPHFNGGAGAGLLEKADDEVEEYSTLLPLEFSLETRVRDIDLALEKIKKGKFGICEKCGENISKERLKIQPEAKFCQKCLKK